MQRLQDSGAPLTMSGSASFRSGSTPAIGTQQQGGAAGRNLFETPPELLCPITRDLLTDPVLTTSGQVGRNCRAIAQCMHACMLAWGAQRQRPPFADSHAHYFAPPK
jgi:hypothetical protein